MSFVTLPQSPKEEKDEDISYTAIELDRVTEEEEMLSCSSTSRRVDGWPEGPQPLRGISLLKFLGDLLLAILPIPFLALVIAVLNLNHSVLSEHGKTIQRLIILGPTLYPLVFAALCGRFLRTFAIWLAEGGTTIETLEKLLRSQSFVSAFGTAITLRSMNTISIPLLLLWFLSPLGGQSTLRLLHETNTTTTGPGSLYYSNPDAPFDLNQNSPWFSVVPTVLSASLSTSPIVRDGPVDLWNHPKIPRIHDVEQDIAPNSNSTGKWFPVPDGVNHTYASLLGISVQGLVEGTHSQSLVNYTYMTVDCSLRYRANETAVLRQLSSSSVCINPPFVEVNNGSAGTNALRTTKVYLQDKETTKINEFLFKYGYNSTTDRGNRTSCNSTSNQNIKEQLYFLYGQNAYTTGMFHTYECVPRFFAVEAQLKCRSDICGVGKVRRVPNDMIQDAVTQCADGLLDKPDQGRRLPCLSTTPKLLDNFVNYFIMSTTSYLTTSEVVNTYSIYDGFILGGNETYPADPKNRTLDSVSTKLMSERLTLILNAYWQAASWGPLVTRMEPFKAPSDSELSASWKPNAMRLKGTITRTNTTVSISRAVYKANIPWCLTLLFTTSVLIVLGILNLILSWLTIAPDLFSYAASMTRDNPYTNNPNGGSALGGTERSRLLKKLRVQIGDVRPYDKVGYVALRSVEKRGEFSTGMLRKGRLYE
ncbi:hypothetical protein GQ44DRAFT_819031 [Phaeosphaeriaceae sp. PMI808]|nr:hypothetical protein GQ44DRAFT_819031 [Phaeosphaeriaceae sp. PMI808]